MYRLGPRAYPAIALVVFGAVLALAAATVVGTSRADAAATPQATLSARAATAAPTVANPRITMEVDGVDGESTLTGYVGWIDLSAVEWGGERVGGTGRTRVIDVDEFAVALSYENAAVNLTEAMLVGKVFPAITVELTKAINGQRLPYLRYRLTNVVVESLASSAGKRPDSYKLNFEEIRATYTDYDATGQPQGSVNYTYTNRP